MITSRSRLFALAACLVSTATMPIGDALARPDAAYRARPSVAGRAISTATGHARFLGRWELDLTKMPSTYGPPPTRVIYTFARAGGGKWRTTIEIVGREGGVRHMAVSYALDGSAAASEGDKAEGDTAAVNAPADNVMVLCLAKDRKLGSVRVYAVSPDGREMTESAADVNDEGVPFVRNFHYRRIG